MGLVTFNPFSEENAFQVTTKTRLGSKFLPTNSGSIYISIFSSSCYGIDNFIASHRSKTHFAASLKLAGGDGEGEINYLIIGVMLVALINLYKMFLAESSAYVLSLYHPVGSKFGSNSDSSK